MEHWQEAVLQLTRQVEDWVVDFHVKKGNMPLTETSLLASPDDPLLEVEVNGQTVIRLEPARFAVKRMPTVVNLYSYPSLRRVRLFGPFGDAWEVQSSEGVAMNYQWNKADFVRLLTELAQENVPGSV